MVFFQWQSGHDRTGNHARRQDDRCGENRLILQVDFAPLDRIDVRTDANVELPSGL